MKIWIVNLLENEKNQMAIKWQSNEVQKSVK